MLTRLWPILSVLNVAVQLPQHRPDHVYHSSFIITGPRRLEHLCESKPGHQPCLVSSIQYITSGLSISMESMQLPHGG